MYQTPRMPRRSGAILRHTLACTWLSLLPAAVHAQMPDSALLRVLRERAAPTHAAIVVGRVDGAGSRSFVAIGPLRAGGVAADSTSLFEIGSITKVFTATLLADMALRGEVALGDPVSKYLPASVHMPVYDDHPITLLDISHQNSGLPRLPNNLQPKDPTDPYADYTVAQLYAFLSGYTLTRAPGAQYEYSNLAVGLLGHVLALRANMSYEAVLKQRVLEPLGLTHTIITMTPAAGARLAVGHDASGREVPSWHSADTRGCGRAALERDGHARIHCGQHHAGHDNRAGPGHGTHTPGPRADRESQPVGGDELARAARG